jgi:hemin uptake protein HemP
MPVISDTVAAKSHTEVLADVLTEASTEASVKASAAASVVRSRATLSVRAGIVSRAEIPSSAGSRLTTDRTVANAAAFGTHNGIVPLKRLTAGRKEIRIAHGGATYLLRITKSNKLILTKTEATEIASPS